MEVQICRVDNERMLKSQEEKNQLGTQLLQRLYHLQKKMKMYHVQSMGKQTKFIQEEKTM
jgi:hypothetical protein